MQQENDPQEQASVYSENQQWLKFINNVYDIRHKYLQRLYDPAPIWKRYRDGEIEAHFHFKHPDLLCLRWRRELFLPLEYLLHLTEFPMAVRVGEFAEQFETVASVVRLMPLEQCYMLVGDALEKPGPVSFEDLFTAFNRKLDAIVYNARFLFRKSRSGIVQSIAKAACELADDNLYFPDIFVARVLDDVEAEFLGNEIGVRVNNVLSKPLQMFTCPLQQEFDFLELIQHAALLSESFQKGETISPASTSDSA